MVSEAFRGIVGQPQAIELLTQAIERDHLAPAYLFVGPEGVGRKRTAQAFLAALMHSTSVHPHRQTENHPDILWVEPTYQHQGKVMTAAMLTEKGIALPKGRPQVRLEQVRDIARFLSQSPLESSRLLVIIEGAQTMAEPAANGLLKTLEEPGQGTLILLAPTVDALLPTIVSRCQKIPFLRLSHTHLHQVLQQASYAELLQDPQLLNMAQGSPGLAIRHWQQCQAIPSEILQQCQSLPQTPRECLTLAQTIAKGMAMDSQHWLLDYLQQRCWAQGWTAPLTPLEKAKTYLDNYVQPQLVWEVTLLQVSQCLAKG
jgi:DNA polymerase III subunit delta'